MSSDTKTTDCQIPECYQAPLAAWFKDETNMRLIVAPRRHCKSTAIVNLATMHMRGLLSNKTSKTAGNAKLSIAVFVGYPSKHCFNACKRELIQRTGLQPCTNGTSVAMFSNDVCECRLMMDTPSMVETLKQSGAKFDVILIDEFFFGMKNAKQELLTTGTGKLLGIGTPHSDDAFKYFEEHRKDVWLVGLTESLFAC